MIFDTQTHINISRRIVFVATQTLTLPTTYEIIPLSIDIPRSDSNTQTHN